MSLKKILITLSLIMVAIGAFAQGKQQSLVNVSGEHSIKVEPDGATVNIMISTENLDLETAKNGNDNIVSTAISFLKKQKIEDKDIRTTHVNLQPYNEYVKDKKPIQMFRAQQSITFKVKDLAKLPDLLSELVKLKVNNIQSVHFTSTKMKALQNEARTEAMLDAKRKATLLADAVNLKIGSAFTIHDNTSSDNFPPNSVYRSYEAADMLSNKQAPIAEGEIEITASVQVSFLLK